LWRLFKFVAASVLVGLLLAFISFLVAAYHRSSKLAEFTEVQIGMERYQVQRILAKGAIMCGLNYGPSETQCTFSDFQRHYIVELDPASGRVVHKGFTWNGPAYYGLRVARY